LYSLTFFEQFNPKIKIILINILKKVLQRLTWEPQNNEKNTQKMLRNLVLESLGKTEDSDVKLEAQHKFKQYLKNPKSISADLLVPIFITVAWNGDNTIHEELMTLYHKVETQEEKIRVLTGLAYFKNKDLIIKTLEFSLSEEVRIQNMATIIKNIGSNPFGRQILWSWLKNNWEKLTTKTKKGNTVLKKILGVISEITDESGIIEVKEFFENNPVPGTENTLKQELERAIIYSRFLKKIKNEFLFT
jgi:aminopeptidase N